jgi:hypothetical protein
MAIEPQFLLHFILGDNIFSFCTNIIKSANLSPMQITHLFCGRFEQICLRDAGRKKIPCQSEIRFYFVLLFEYTDEFQNESILNWYIFVAYFHG